ncbi:MAG: transglycosylase domain-containing protein [Myxococcales bacterium]|nr:MAG: transglycosylase domain-containing protein [Myxococcales bacterium]
MLRFLSERRAWVIAALVALVLAAGLWMWGAPRATARVSRAIGDRLGVVAEIDEARFRPGRVELRGIEMRGQHGGFVARIEEIDAKMSLLVAVFKGGGAVRRLSVRGIDLEADLAHEGFSESIALVRNEVAPRSADARAEAPSKRPRGGGRAYELTGLTVRVVDRDGPLVSMNDVSLHKEGDDLSSSASETLLGDRSADHAFVGPHEIALRRNDGAWTLRKLAIETGNVRALRNGDAQRRALALRLRDAVASLRGLRQEQPDAEDIVEAVEIAEQEADLPEEPAVPEEPPKEGPRPSARLFTRLAPDADIAVSGVQIESRTTDDGRVERIRDFGVGVKGGSNGWYHVVVGGETSNKGTLNVDLSLKPSEARAEGSLRLRRISLALIAPFVPELPLYDTEVGTISAKLELDANSPDRVAIEGGFQVRELAVFHERIAADPIRDINVDIRGKGAWLPDERRLEIEGAQVRMGKATVLLEGELERTPEHYRADLTLKLPPTDCNDVVGAIPEDVLGSLSRFEWSGNWSALTHISLDSRDLEATELSIKVRNLCLFEDTPRWVRVERFQEPFRHRAVEPDESVFQMVTGPGTDNWVAFADISPFMVPAVISHEDGGFYDHAGFAPWAIRDALVRNLREGRYVVGASTISMQLAKNLYLQREKTIARKVQEVLLTWWLENALTKDQILELYLNVIEYGPSVYGLKHAAAYYFGRAPSELSPAETAFLACVLPSPKNYHVSYERGALTRSMKNRTRRLLEHMAKRERIGSEALAFGLAELEDFHFYREGDPPPPPRVLPPLGAPEELDPAELDPFEALFLTP